MDDTNYLDTKLHVAVRYGESENVSCSLKEGFSPNEIGTYLWSPLHEACNNGDYEIVKLLLDSNGDPNKRDSLRGNTAVHYAASQNHLDVLKLLLVSGGLTCEKNSDEQTPEDVATGECKNFLQKKDKSNSVSRIKSEDIFQGGKSSDVKDSISVSKSSDCSETSGYQQELEMDIISIDSNSSNGSYGYSSYRSFSPDMVKGVKEDPILGHVQLSFEYNSKKATFRIRVWQVEDLLMPSASNSMIQSIYVKSRLLPDKKKESKRKTEEVKIDKQEGLQSLEQLKSASEIFKPSCFVFNKPLEYKDVTEQMIEDRIFQLQVCIVQKRTRKSFIIATFSISMTKAVSLLKKEKYPLSLYKNLALPQNMRVYDGSDLQSSHTAGIASKHISARGTSISMEDPFKKRSASETDLNTVTVDSTSTCQRIPSIEILMPDPDDLELESSLREIQVMEQKEQVLSCKVNVDSLRDSGLDDSIYSSDSGLEVHVERDIAPVHVVVHST